MTQTRTETDSFRRLRCLLTKYWGAQTKRSDFIDFPSVGQKTADAHRSCLLALSKKACAQANADVGPNTRLILRAMRSKPQRKMGSVSARRTNFPACMFWQTGVWNAST